MKKLLSVLAVALLLAMALTACGGSRTLSAEEQELVGTWDVYSYRMGDMEITTAEAPEIGELGMYITFKDDGTIVVFTDEEYDDTFTRSGDTITVGKGIRAGDLQIDSDGLILMTDDEINEEMGMEVVVTFAKR